MLDLLYGALIGPLPDGYHRLARWTLAERIIEEVERLHQEKTQGRSHG